MENEYLQKVTKYPEIINITKPNVKNLVIHSEYTPIELIESVLWIYQNHHDTDIVLFLPECKMDLFDKFNKVECNLHNIENYNFKSNEIVIFIFMDHILNVLLKLNKKRTLFQLKAISKKCKTTIFSTNSLKFLNIPAFEGYQFYEFKTKSLINFKTFLDYTSIISLIDPDPEVYSENLDSFISLIDTNKHSRIYLSLNLSINKILEIESALKKLNITVSRKDSPDSQVVVINSIKTTEKINLKYHYDIYILILPDIECSLELVFYIKDLFTLTEPVEIYIDDTTVKNVSDSLKDLCTYQMIQKPIIKDSIEFNSYKDLLPELKFEPIMAMESYHLFNLPESFLKMNLDSLSKKDCEQLRHFIKVKLMDNFDYLG